MRTDDRTTARGRSRNRARSVGRLGTVPLALVVLAFAASGCFSSGYTYLSRRNSDNSVLYFKIPSRWKIFTSAQVIEKANGHLTRTQLNQLEANEWVIPFSDAPNATVPRQLSAFGIKHPAGVALAQELTADDRDSYSLASLRAALLGTDPLASGSNMTVLSYSEFTRAGGFRGDKMIVDVPQSNGVVITMGQVAIVDAQTNWIYVVGAGCEASCWNTNQGTIEQILNSWQVKAR